MRVGPSHLNSGEPGLDVPRRRNQRTAVPDSNLQRRSSLQTTGWCLLDWSARRYGVLDSAKSLWLEV